MRGLSFSMLLLQAGAFTGAFSNDASCLLQPRYVSQNTPQLHAGRVPCTEQQLANKSRNHVLKTVAGSCCGCGTVAYGNEALFGGEFLTMPIPAGTPFTSIALQGGGFKNSGTFGPDGTLYFTEYGSGNLFTVDITNGNLALIGSTGVNLNGITYDYFRNLFWGVSSTALYSVDVSSASVTFVGLLGLGSGLMIDVAVALDGSMYAYSVDFPSAGKFYSVNPLTGAATFVGNLGFVANYGQGMAYDHSTGVLYLSAFNVGTISGQLRTVDVTLGTSALLQDWGVQEIAAFAIDVPRPHIDIKFCSNPNAFNCKRLAGVLPLTAFGCAVFDVSDMDVTTLRLCLASDSDQCIPSGPRNVNFVDRGNPDTDLGTDRCTNDVANADGFLDADIAFEAAEVAELIGCEELSKGDASPTLVLVGHLLAGGTRFQSRPFNNVGIDQLLIQNA